MHNPLLTYGKRLLLSLVIAAGLPTLAGAQSAKTQDVSIQAQPLSSALLEFAEQSDLEILFDDRLVQGRTAPVVEGSLTVEQVLQQLLAGTDLAYRFTDANTVTLAQTATGENTLAPIRVEGARGNFGRSPTFTANVGDTTTATRIPVETRKVPRSVGVVSEQLIEETNSARDLGDLSSYVSGVSRETDIARAGNFFVRGFPVGNRATVDGFRNPRGLASASTFTITDLALYERVEFLKGASAILHGRGEPGGNVNYVSKKPRFDTARSLSFSRGPDDYYRGVFDATGPISDELAYRVIGAAQNANYFTPATQDDRLILNPSLLWNTPGGGELYVDYEYNRTDFISGDNAVLINGEIVPYQQHDPINEFDNQFRTHNARLQFEQPLTEAWTLALDGAYSNQDHLQRRILFAPDSTMNPTQSEGTAFSQDRTDEAYGVRPELRGEFGLGPTQHRLTVGYEYFDGEGRFERNLFGDFGTGPVFDQQFGAPLPPPLDPPPEFLILREDKSVYLFDYVDIGERWHLLSGVRYTEFERIRVDLGRAIVDASGTSPSLGAVYDFSPRLSAYASWSQSLDQNGGMDVNGNTFDPSEGEQFEFGLKGDWFNERLFYTLAVFDLTQTNVATADPNNPNFSELLGEVNIRGVELDMSSQITDRLSGIVTLTYHDSEVTENNDGFEGTMLANTPEFSGTLRLSYRATDDLRYGGSLIHVGERQGANFGTPFEVDDYTRLDLDLSWRVSEVQGLTLFATAENVTDEDYVLGSRSPTQIQLGRPRGLTLRAKYDF